MSAQPTPVQVPLTNGYARSFAQVRVVAAGMSFNGGIKSIKRSRTRSREKVRSNHPDPVAKTQGENDYQCSVVLYIDWYFNFIQTINNTLGAGYGDQPFELYITYVGRNLTQYTDKVVNCTFDKDEIDASQGTAALTCEIELNPTKIYFGGQGGIYLDDVEDPLVPPQ